MTMHASAPDAAPRLIFGIFPGISGTEDATYRDALASYDPDQVDAALERLQPPGRPFVVRGYAVYKGNGRAENVTPPDVGRFIHDGRRLDQVLCYRSPDGDLDDWTGFIRQTIAASGPILGSLQIGEEANNPDPATGGDGGSPNVHRALIEGVFAARDETRRRGLNIAIGINATVSFRPDDDFWPTLAALGGPELARSLDYVGLDFFPDVFRRVPPDQLRAAVELVLRHFRTVNLGAGGIPATVPIRITENGWATGPDRPPERQAEVIETVIRIVDELRGALNITHHVLFALRDAEPGNPEKLCQFGLMRLDYEPKPAFETYRRLIAELGAETWPA